MASSVSYSRPAWCQERLHKWTLWRISINQELIHGMEGVQSPPGVDPHTSYTDNYSLTQQYIHNPGVEMTQTHSIRSAYGRPASPGYPMGDALYLLYGLPRVSASVRMPDVYSSMPDLTVINTTDDRRQHKRPSTPELHARQNIGTSYQRRVTGQMPHMNDGAYHLESKNWKRGLHYKYQLPASDGSSENDMRHDKPGHLYTQYMPQSPNTGRHDAHLTTQYISQSPNTGRHDAHLTTQHIPQSPNTDRHDAPSQSSPLNFRDEPESGPGRTERSISKPVLVPPSVFQSEVLKRSSTDLSNTRDPDRETFEDPRAVAFNDRATVYKWGESDSGDRVEDRRVYVDESHLKTHM